MTARTQTDAVGRELEALRTLYRVATVWSNAPAETRGYDHHSDALEEAVSRVRRTIALEYDYDPERGSE